VPQTRPAYPQEFRANAVRLLRSSGKSKRELARDLGCSANSLREWAKRTDLDAGHRTDGLTSDERAELARLRRENKVLAEEREILKKAAAFFATETGRTR
jgi:transposase